MTGEKNIQKYKFNDDIILIDDVNEFNLNFLNLFFEYPQTICLQERNTRRTLLLLIRF